MKSTKEDIKSQENPKIKLVVKSPFDNYSIGDCIEEENDIKSVLAIASRNVIKVLSQPLEG